MWFVHYLFLDAINEDAHKWAEIWNACKAVAGGVPRIFFTRLLPEVHAACS